MNRRPVGRPRRIRRTLAGDLALRFEALCDRAAVVAEIAVILAPMFPGDAQGLAHAVAAVLRASEAPC